MASTGQTGAVQPAAAASSLPSGNSAAHLANYAKDKFFLSPLFLQTENPDVQSFNRDCKAKLREDGKAVTGKHEQGLHVHTLWD